jgi:hypothetical protein
MNAAQQPNANQPVTQEQLEELASNVYIALHALLDGLEIAKIKPDALEQFLPEIKEKVEQVNPY